MTSRRSFLIKTVAAAATLPAAQSVLAQAAAKPRLDEKNAQAAALGYVHDTKKVDAKKFPRHAASQNCANCQLYKAGKDGWGDCSIFPANVVNANGWCSAWVKKAG
ncbi:high-potential iron-sulfur protein [Piscinibacterium candidicorallinum]|jgi:hypothetical protein|uniref:High-potential iron-sulfur protein n=1 Tax=Piscinibacterium candidicorallinum TaxID=1793872 RepID=A0ABV7GYL4_9BURK